jgi:carbonic anhydrase
VRKLICGILDFRTKYLDHYTENYSHLEEKQEPDTLLLTCSDSRVSPHIFASTNPGDVFVLRNIGNIIPSLERLDPTAPSAEAAAIEFALSKLPITDIIICGHSNCGAMEAILSGPDQVESPYMKNWLSFSCCCPEDLPSCSSTNKDLSKTNQLAQMNVLQQIAHLKTFPIVQEKTKAGKLNIHGWYFDLGTGNVYNFKGSSNEFLLIDEKEARRILKNLK